MARIFYSQDDDDRFRWQVDQLLKQRAISRDEAHKMLGIGMNQLVVHNSDTITFDYVLSSDGTNVRKWATVPEDSHPHFELRSAPVIEPDDDMSWIRRQVDQVVALGR